MLGQWGPFQCSWQIMAGEQSEVRPPPEHWNGPDGRRSIDSAGNALPPPMKTRATRGQPCLLKVTSIFEKNWLLEFVQQMRTKLNTMRFFQVMTSKVRAEAVRWLGLGEALPLLKAKARPTLKARPTIRMRGSVAAAASSSTDPPTVPGSPVQGSPVPGASARQTPPPSSEQYDDTVPDWEGDPPVAEIIDVESATESEVEENPWHLLGHVDLSDEEGEEETDEEVPRSKRSEVPGSESAGRSRSPERSRGRHRSRSPSRCSIRSRLRSPTRPPPWRRQQAAVLKPRAPSPRRRAPSPRDWSCEHCQAQNKRCPASPL